MAPFKSLCLLLLGTLLFSACQKEIPAELSSENSAPAPRMSPLRAELIAGDWDNYLQKWNTLSSEAQYSVWVEKLTEVHEMPQWSSPQREKIAHFRALLSPAVFEQPLTDRQDSLLFLEMTEVFNPYEVSRIFMDVYPFEVRPMEIGREGK